MAILYNHTDTREMGLYYYQNHNIEIDHELKGVILAAGVRFGGGFEDLFPILQIDSNNTMIDAISSTVSLDHHIMLLNMFSQSPKRLVILNRLLYLGHYRVVWDFLKKHTLDHPSKADMLLELAVIQFQESSLVEEAKNWKRMSIQRGLERLEAFENLRKSINEG